MIQKMAASHSNGGLTVGKTSFGRGMGGGAEIQQLQRHGPVAAHHYFSGPCTPHN